MTDDVNLAVLGKYTPEGKLTSGYGNSYLFFVGRDDVRGILLELVQAEKRNPEKPTVDAADAWLADEVMQSIAAEGAILARRRDGTRPSANPLVAVQTALLRSPSTR